MQILARELRSATAKLPVDQLNSHCHSTDLNSCGPKNARLCVRVDSRLGRYDQERDYFVIRGY